MIEFRPGVLWLIENHRTSQAETDMNKPTITLSLLALGFGAIASSQPPPDRPLSFKEERMTFEYTVGAGEGVIIIEAESEESLGRIEVNNPDGEPILQMWTAPGQTLSLQSFIVETRESSAAEILSAFSEGVYDLRGRTDEGEEVVGSALLSHEMLRAPVVTFPLDGAVGVPTNLNVSWVPDPDARAYKVVVEQNDNDGLTVELPAGSHNFQVPDGFLESGTETFVEVGAVSRNGNCTLVEVSCTTW